MKRNIYRPAIRCSCGLHTWPTLLQSVCKVIYLVGSDKSVCVSFGFQKQEKSLIAHCL